MTKVLSLITRDRLFNGSVIAGILCSVGATFYVWGIIVFHLMPCD